jgi:hypothetical protein
VCVCVCSTGASASIIIATLHQQQQLDEHTTHPKLLIMGSCRSPVLSSPMQLPLARPPRAGSASPPPTPMGRHWSQEGKISKKRETHALVRRQTFLAPWDETTSNPDPTTQWRLPWSATAKTTGLPELASSGTRWVRASRGRDPCALESPARRTVTSAAPMRAACLRPRAPRPRRGTRACLAGRPTRTSP